MEDGITAIEELVFHDKNKEEEEEEEGTTVEREKGRDVVEGERDVQGEEKESGGGIFNSLISGILHQSGGEKDEASGGGLIDNIISHLPTPLADDAAPATDEASILIHSIVHD